MNKTLLISLIAGGVVILGVGGVFAYKLVTKNSSPTTSQTSSINPTSTTTSSSSSSTNSNASAIAGEYWCFSYNVNSMGSTCELQRPLFIYANGTYAFSTTTGNFTYNGSDKITFTGGLSTRGVATYASGKQIRWEFTTDGKPYTITYYFRQAVSSTAAPASSTTTSAPVTAQTPSVDISGSYSCTSANCQTGNQLVLKADGNWSMAADIGTYTVSGSTVTFTSPFGTGPAAWGPATLSGNTVTFKGSNGDVVFSK